MSMIGQRTLAWVDKRLRQATGHLHLPMGGVSIILFGDFGQLPPVGDRPLYASPSSSELAIHGHTLYRMFTTVVILNQILRQNGNDSDDEVFRNLLMHLRNGQVSHSDWQLLMQRTAQHVHNIHEFEHAVRLFYDKLSVAQYNSEKLQTLNMPIARINAIHSCAAAANAKPDDAGGLYPVVFLAEHSQVMLTANLWQEVGLCNGAIGTVYKLLYTETNIPPNLPIAVLVDFNDYIGPTFLSDKPKCIPVPPLLSEWVSSGKHLSRLQIPLQLCYATTIHKSQGRTLPKAVIDIGQKELAAGCTFIAVSHLRKLEDSLFAPMSIKRLQAIANSKHLAARITEEQRLLQLSYQNQ